MRTLLAITPYYFSERDFYELREPVKEYPIRHFIKQLPEWTVRDNGYIDWAENYHQWSGMEKDVDSDLSILFDAQPIDYLLQEEISYGGLPDLLEGFDWNRFFKNVPINGAPIRTAQIPNQVYMVIDLQYHGGRDSEGFMDYELEAIVVGYLDGNLQLCEI